MPLRVVCLGLESLPLIRQMVDTGNPNSITDAGVGALCARAAVLGAALNVKVNAVDLEDKEYAAKVVAEADAAMAEANRLEGAIFGYGTGKNGRVKLLWIFKHPIPTD